MDEQSTKSNNLAIPIAIVIAGTLIAGAVYMEGRRSTQGITSEAAEEQEEARRIASREPMAPVTSEDHIRGNPNAPVKIVEYSDMECPFCRRFHTTMKQVMDGYGKDGKVVWVYRHLPLDSIHSKARPEAVAAECADELGGNDAFWTFIDRFFELTPSNNQTELETVIPQIPREIGLNESRFA